MKKKFYAKVIPGLLLLGIIAAACSKDETPEPETFETLSFDSEEVLAMLPSGLQNSSDFYAQLCVSYVTTAVDMSGFVSSMEVPSDARRSAKKSSMAGDTWQWSWSYGGQSMTLFWSFDEDGSRRSWSMDIQYNGGPVFDYIDAWEYKDGTGGEVLYNFNWVSMNGAGMAEEAEELYWKYNWTKNGAGDYTIDWYWESGSSEYAYLVQYGITLKADGSGSLNSYAEDARLYHMEWDARGNGSWTMGEGQETGSWTAG